MIDNSNETITNLHEKLEDVEKQYYQAVESAMNYVELIEEYEDIDEVVASDELIFNDKIDHVNYENSETRVFIYSILIDMVDKLDNMEKERYSIKEIEALIGKIRWIKHMSNSIIEEEQCLIKECDYAIAILDKMRVKEK